MEIPEGEAVAQIRFTTAHVLSLVLISMFVAAHIALGQGVRRTFSTVELVPPATSPVQHVIEIADINSGGDFVGSHIVENQRRPFAVIDEAWYDLGLDQSRATAINDAGTVLIHRFQRAQSDGFFWNRENGLVPLGPGRPADLGPSAFAGTMDGIRSFVCFRNEPSVSLEPLEGGTFTSARAIDQTLGTTMVAGESNARGDTIRRGVVWKNGQVFDLTPTATRDAHVVDVNSQGLVAGWRELGSGSRQPLAWIPLRGGTRWRAITFEHHFDTPRDLNAEHDILLSNGLWSFDLQSGSHRFVPVTSRMNVPRSIDIDQPVTLHAINDAGMIIGLGRRNDGTTAVLQIMPHDLNNNRVPDYREIVRDPSVDLDEDWIVDIAQQMRSGFYNISVPWRVIDKVQPIQVVRIILDQGNLAEIMNDPDGEVATAFAEQLNGWGYERGVELVLSIRTPTSFDADLDYIPVDDERRMMLDVLERFAERHARAIDYVQLGNESLGGIGAFYFSPEQVPCHGGEGGSVKDIGGECIREVVRQINEWVDDQSVAVRRGAHRAGRPLQILSPAVNEGHLALGAKGDPLDFKNMRPDDHPEQTDRDRQNRAALVVDEMLRLSTSVFDLIDLHGRYHFEVGQLLNAARLAYEPETPWGERGHYPNGLCVTEWAPMPLPDPLRPGDPGTWFQAHMATPANGGVLPNIKTYFENYEGKLPPPMWSWSELLHDWRFTETTLDESFGIPDALRGLDHYDVVFACYAPFNQYDNLVVESLKPYNISAIYARDVKPEYLGLTRFTYLRGVYELAAAPYTIENFNPHPEPFE